MSSERNDSKVVCTYVLVGERGETYQGKIHRLGVS